MRCRQTENDVTVMAYAGATGVLLAMDVPEAKRQGLLGFAIERYDVTRSRQEWLQGMLPFPGMLHKAGDLIDTCQAPIQKFRWSDYRLYPGREYEYTVHPVYGTPGQPCVEAGPTVRVAAASDKKGEHVVLFNRAAAASQAFSRKFPQVDKELDLAKKEKREPELPKEALQWLTRGVLGQIVGFIRKATGKAWALDIAIYEYELPEIIQAVEAAHRRGANVRVVYHAKKGDDQTAQNRKNLAGLPASCKRARLTSAICHHKFIVLSKIAGGKRQPVAVLCGSTNFTHNGIYRQANVVHVVDRPDVARQYLDLFEVLFGGADPAATRRYINKANPMAVAGPLFAGFSPRSKLADLGTFAELIRSARRDVLFCTAFNLHASVEDALLGVAGDPILRYGLQNTRSSITGFHADRGALFVAAAMLSKGLEGFLKESTKGQKGNILIHTKLVIVDFTSDSPTIISGSHNLSKAASQSNDENYLVLRGDADVADCYGCELLRLYDHYRFRHYAKTHPGQSAGALDPDDRWTAPYFDPSSLKCRDRRLFAGGEG